MPWASLDDQFHGHPKVIAAGLDGAGLYARALSYCAAYLTDGFVPLSWAREAAGGRTRILSSLCEVGLWTKQEGGFQIRDFTDFNPPREWVLARRSELSEKRAKAGKLGAEKRWQRDGKGHGKQDGKQDGKGHGKQIANAWPPAPSPTKDPKGSNRDVSPTAVPSENDNYGPEPDAADFETGEQGKALRRLAELGSPIGKEF